MSTTCPELARVSGAKVNFIIVDEPYRADTLESHRTGRALMRAMQDDPSTSDAATPRQAWTLAAAITAIFIAFLLGWTFLGLPAPELTHLD